MSEPVTVQITREVSPEMSDRVPEWVRRGEDLLAARPGYLGSGWVREADGSSTWHMLVRFASDDALAAWRDSPERAAWRAEFEHHVHSTRSVHRTGIEGWFDSPVDEARAAAEAGWSPSEADAGFAAAGDEDASPVTPTVIPPRWKQAVVIFVGFYPISLLANWLLPYAVPADWQLWLRVAITTIIVTPIMTYWILPFVTRLFAPWTMGVRRGR